MVAYCNRSACKLLFADVNKTAMKRSKAWHYYFLVKGFVLKCKLQRNKFDSGKQQTKLHLNP